MPPWNGGLKSLFVSHKVETEKYKISAYWVACCYNFQERVCE